MKNKSGKFRIISIIVILVAVATFISACASAPAPDNASEAQYSMNKLETGRISGASTPSVSTSQDVLYGYGMNDYEYDGEIAESSDTDEYLPSDRKIIQDAWLDIECEDASVLYEQLSDFCKSLGGYQFSYDMSQRSEYSVINATLKIPPEKLDQFLEFAGECGKIINKKLNSDDITESYYDTQTRIETKRKALAQYFELLKTADTVENIVYIQKTIDGLTEEIESLEGRIKRWNSLVEMATVNLYIRQENDPVKIKRDIDWSMLSLGDVGYLIKSGFISVVSVFVTTAQWALIIVVSSAPVWVFVLAVIWIFKIIYKRRKAKHNHVAKNNVKTTGIEEDDGKIE